MDGTNNECIAATVGASAGTTAGATNNDSLNIVEQDWVCFDNSVDDTLNASNKPSVSGVTNRMSDDAQSHMDMEVANDNAAGATGTTPSSTAYSFTGYALSRETISNLNLLKNKSSNGTTNSATANATNNNAEKKDDDGNKSEDSLFECNICLDTAKDAVVSLCGHLFCWPCLHQWLETRPNRKLCPVCKAAVDKDKVIPIYGRNSIRQEDPRNKVPPRPAGQRTEPEPQPGFPGLGFGDGFHMSFGIGAFPFGFFTSSLNFGEPRPAAANRGTTQFEDEQTLSKLFLYLAFMCIGWLLFA